MAQDPARSLFCLLIAFRYYYDDLIMLCKGQRWAQQPISLSNVANSFSVNSCTKHIVGSDESYFYER